MRNPGNGKPEGRREGRTAVYLGHLALLENCLVEAETWYQTAEQADQDQGVPFNPYLVMGRIALAWRQGDHTGVRQQWNQHREALDGPAR